MMMDDTYDQHRFVTAQDHGGTYDQAIADPRLYSSIGPAGSGPSFTTRMIPPAVTGSATRREYACRRISMQAINSRW